jgi:hypothetical protein
MQVFFFFSVLEPEVPVYRVDACDALGVVGAYLAVRD